MWLSDGVSEYNRGVNAFLSRTKIYAYRFEKAVRAKDPRSLETGVTIITEDHA